MLRHLLFIGFVVANVCSFGQNVKIDSSFIADAKKNVVASYSNSISAQSHLYNGSAYTEYISQNEENPYFIDEWIEGSVVYDEEFHDNVPLLYDISIDRIVVDNQFSIKKVLLVFEKVSDFTIQGHHFVMMKNTPLQVGYYELAYDGSSKVYVRHRKALQSKVVDYSVVNLFEEKKIYYIYKNGAFYTVRGKRSVVKLLEDKKKELKKFIRDNKLQFGNEKTRDISRLVQYYDQLK
ncbi:MAG: hypothetical protein WDO15_25405 [Bacteroidota bacterium]